MKLMFYINCVSHSKSVWNILYCRCDYHEEKEVKDCALGNVNRFA